MTQSSLRKKTNILCFNVGLSMTKIDRLSIEYRKTIAPTQECNLYLYKLPMYDNSFAIRIIVRVLLSCTYTRRK